MANKTVKETIHAKGIDISIYTMDFQNEFISLTDIAKYKSDDPTAVIQNWMRNRDVIEFLGLWEGLHNPDFKPLEFEGFRNQAGANAFTMSPKKWIETTGAVGIVSKSGRYGGTFAHSDIAFEFASWISPEFKLYIIKNSKLCCSYCGTQRCFIKSTVIFLHHISYHFISIASIHKHFHRELSRSYTCKSSPLKFPLKMR